MKDVTDGMDLEGRLRFHADAIRKAPSLEPVPGTGHAERWQRGRDGRADVIREACALLDEVGEGDVGTRLAIELRVQSGAMLAGLDGIDTAGTFHGLNWNDKPHRVAYDAASLMERAADAIAAR